MNKIWKGIWWFFTGFHGLADFLIWILYESDREDDRMKALRWVRTEYEFQDFNFQTGSLYPRRLYAAIEYVQDQIQYVGSDALKKALSDTKQWLELTLHDEWYFLGYTSEWEDCFKTTRGKEKDWIAAHHMPPTPSA